MDIQPKEVFPTCKVIVLVIDAQMRSYPEQLKYCENTILLAHKYNQSIKFHVFIHKVETEENDEKETNYSLYRDIHDGITKAMRSHSKTFPISCHMTSIYDQSCFLAFSKVTQCLMLPQIKNFLEKMLNLLVHSCLMEKAYIFDILS
eukprot:UN30047